jgi:hypothetical protein
MPGLYVLSSLLLHDQLILPQMQQTQSADCANIYNNNMVAVMDSISKDLSFNLKSLPKAQQGFHNRETALLLLSPKVELSNE